MRPDTIELKVAKRISRRKADVFLRGDFADLGGYDQVGRALRELVRKGDLIKIGKGFYARAIASPFNGRPVPTKGVTRLMAEALGRMGVKTAPTEVARAYHAGQTTQVPTGRVVGVDRRVRRRFAYNGFTVSFERA